MAARTAYQRACDTGFAPVLSSRKAVRFARLDVTVWSPDRKGPPGRLSRQGPPVLSWTRYEAGQAHARALIPDYRYCAQVKDRPRASGTAFDLGTCRLTRCVKHTSEQRVAGVETCRALIFAPRNPGGKRLPVADAIPLSTRSSRRLHPARRSCWPRWAIANTRKPRSNSARSARPWVGRHRDMPCLGEPPWYIDHDPQARGNHDRDGTSKRTDRPH